VSAARSAADVEAAARDQFTVHAESFAAAAVITDGQALDALADLAQVGPGDRVLDVACGPGIVAVHLATAGAHVTGVDLTPRMLELARARADDAGVGDRCEFLEGRMDELAFDDGTFTVTVSRYALHHAADPALVAAEMCRVTAPGGRVVVVDFAADREPDVAAAYDDAERLRDPSHVRNLTADEQRDLFESLGVRLDRTTSYRLTADLDTVLAGSHGVDHDGVRRAFEASLDGHGLGVDARRNGDGILFDYPIVGTVFVRT
jgi:ubiquinone/menaquinone biosynthesis C-methylase UbiE